MVAYNWLQIEQGKCSSILTPLSMYNKEKIISFVAHSVVCRPAFAEVT